MKFKEKLALLILEDMNDDEFNKFLNTLPNRTQILVRGGLVNWKDVLPAWYIQRGYGEDLNEDDINYIKEEKNDK